MVRIFGYTWSKYAYWVMTKQKVPGVNFPCFTLRIPPKWKKKKKWSRKWAKNTSSVNELNRYYRPTFNNTSSMLHLGIVIQFEQIIKLSFSNQPRWLTWAYWHTVWPLGLTKIFIKWDWKLNSILSLSLIFILIANQTQQPAMRAWYCHVGNVLANRNRSAWMLWAYLLHQVANPQQKRQASKYLYKYYIIYQLYKYYKE